MKGKKQRERNSNLHSPFELLTPDRPVEGLEQKHTGEWRVYGTYMCFVGRHLWAYVLPHPSTHHSWLSSKQANIHDPFIHPSLCWILDIKDIKVAKALPCTNLVHSKVVL